MSLAREEGTPTQACQNQQPATGNLFRLLQALETGEWHQAQERRARQLRRKRQNAALYKRTPEHNRNLSIAVMRAHATKEAT